MEQLITEIEQELDCGLKVYLHIKELTLITFPDDSEFFFVDDEFWETQREKLKGDPVHYIEIEKWNSSYSFRLMSSFTENMDDHPVLKAQLSEALTKPKPFKNFKSILEDYDQNLEEWYSFKSLQQKEFVKDQLIALKITV